MTPKEFYTKFSMKRSDYEDRAEAISAVSLPYLMREEGDNGSSSYRDNVAQSFNGRLINTLTAKMGMSLLPPSTSSFRLEPDAEALVELTQGDPDAQAAIYAMLSNVTSRINKEIEAQQIRDTLFDMIRQLIAVGPVVMEKKDKGRGIMLHTLRNIAVDLDSTGEARGICIVEKIKDLPQGIELVESKMKPDGEEYELYTLVKRDSTTGKWTMTQSIDGDIVGEAKTYSDERNPFQYVGWTWVSGDSYHRPYAEDYLPDMEQYNALSNLLTKGSIVAAKVLIFVDEKGNRTRKSDVANSEHGDVVNGRADDVTAFQLQKNFDFQVPMERLNDIGKNLSLAFLMNESVTRDAERVTAEEIRFMAQELETSSLSGVYSKLSKKVSKWIVQKIMQELGITFQGIDVNVVTGLDALGRSQEARKLDAYIGRMANLGLMDYVDESELIQRYASFDGIDTTNLIKSPTTVRKERQARADAQARQVGMESFAQKTGEAVAPQAGQG